jgi:hypothetical protein
MLPLLLAGVKRVFPILLYDYPTLRGEGELEGWKLSATNPPLFHPSTLPFFHPSLLLPPVIY